MDELDFQVVSEGSAEWIKRKLTTRNALKNSNETKCYKISFTDKVAGGI